MDIAVLIFYCRHYVGNGIFAAADILDYAAELSGNHYLMQHDIGLLHSSYNVAGVDHCTGLDGSLELPYLVALESRYGNAAAEIVAADLHYIVERTLDAVVYAFDKSGAEFNGKLTAGRYDRLAGAEAGCFLVYLY